MVRGGLPLRLEVVDRVGRDCLLPISIGESLEDIVGAPVEMIFSIGDWANVVHYLIGLGLFEHDRRNAV